METPLDILMKATHFVENQQSNCSSHVNRSSNTNIATNEERLIKENGHADHVTSSFVKASAPAQEASSYHSFNKQPNLRYTPALDESGTDRIQESMRYSEVSSSDETANMSQYSRNGTLQRMYGVDEKLSSAYRATDSPLKSSPRKRSSSPSSRTETEHPAKMHMPQQLNPLIATAAAPPVGHLPTANPVLPYMQSVFPIDPALYADALARHSLANSDANRPGASPASTSTTQAVNDAITSQGLSRLMYPVPSSTLLMAPRAQAAAGFALPDLLVPSQLAAAYGPAAGLLPQQLPAWSAVPDAEKRVIETMAAASLSPQHLQAQWLTNPYLKNLFSTPNNEFISAKDPSRSVPKPTVPAGVGLGSFPQNYSAEFLLKYPESLNAELLKQADRTLASQSLSPGVSPETIKKSGIAVHHPSEVLAPSGLSKPSLMDWKIPATTARVLKHEGGQLGFESRPNVSTNRRDPVYNENHELQVKTEETRHKLSSLVQRPGSGNESYAGRYNSLERQSPSPFAADRWDEYRRRSRDFSPHLSPNASDKMGKKRSQEIFGIPHDLIPPERKNHSPSTSATIGGLRQSKSPQRASKSPIDHPVTASSLLASLTGKPNPTGGDKDNPALYPYMLHPFGGYPLSFALPASYLCQPDISSSSSSKAMADALNVAAAAQANAAVGSQFFRAQQESALSADLAARWPSLAYTSFLQHQQHLQQALKATFPPSSTTSADFLKYQKSLLDSRDKEGVASPSHQALASARRFMPNSNISPAPKMTRASPALSQNKANMKNPTQGLNHLYKPRPGSPVRAPEGLDGRAIKRESSPPGAKRAIPTAISPHGFTRNSASNIRYVEEERNRLKRKAAEDTSERSFSKEASVKRKRELTTETASDVDEHFRRSLGSDYKDGDGQNRVHISANVDDHFQKALGTAVWSKVSGSPAVTDTLPNGRDPRSVHAALHSGLSHPLYFPSIRGTLPDSRCLTSLSYAVHPPMNMAGSRTVKSGGTVYPELKTDPSLPAVPSTSGQNETSKRPAAFSDLRPQPPAYDAAVRRQNDAQEPAFKRALSSPHDKPKKTSISQGSSPRSNTSQNSSERPAAGPLAENAHPGTPVSLSHTPSLHAITNGYSKSPTKAPPAYSPGHINNNSSSPTHPVSVDRQLSEESNKSAPPMSVQS